MRLFRRIARRFSRRESAPPIAPEGRIYAIGDIHGRADLLEQAMERILKDASDTEEVPEVVILGDFVDRGEDVRATIDFLIAAEDWPEINLVVLLGNHEKMLLDFLADPEGNIGWLRYGGLQTLLSYGLSAHENIRAPEELFALVENLGEVMGEHRDFIERALLCHQSGNVFFVHAAADPLLPPESQTPETLLWGHPEFPARPRSDGLWVVHGHVVVNEPVARNGVIAIDTGAYFSHRLTAARIEPGRVSFL